MNTPAGVTSCSSRYCSLGKNLQRLEIGNGTDRVVPLALELADLLGEPIGNTLLRGFELLRRQVLAGAGERLSARRAVIGSFLDAALLGLVRLVEREETILVGSLIGFDDGRAAEDDRIGGGAAIPAS